MGERMTDRYSSMDAVQLTRLLRQRDKQMVTQTKFWVRAGKEALAGDTRSLRLRIAMAESEPVGAVLSDDKPPA